MAENEIHFRNTDDCIKKIKSIRTMYRDTTPSYVALSDAIQALEEIQQYRAIGTIEEIKALKEKSVPRKIKGIRFEEAICPRCESELFETYWAFGGIHYCSNCGQTIDWQ